MAGREGLEPTYNALTVHPLTCLAYLPINFPTCKNPGSLSSAGVLSFCAMQKMSGPSRRTRTLRILSRWGKCRDMGSVFHFDLKYRLDHMTCQVQK